MDLKQLKTFICVAEAGSLSRASDRLRIAQPALSRHIKLLEADIGVELFVRHVRGMDLTEPGKELLQRVAGLVRQLDQSVQDVQSMRSEVKGNVAIGLMPTVTSVLAVPLVERVNRELPDVSLRLVEGYSGHLVEWLQRGDVDISFLYGPSTDFHLRSLELLYEPISLVSPIGAFPDSQQTVSLTDAAALPLAMPSHPHGMRIVLDAACEKAGIKLTPALVGDSYHVLKSIVSGGVYHTLLPKSAIQGEVRAGHVEARDLVSPAVNRQLILAMPSDRTNTRATDAVVAIVKKEIAKMIDDGDWVAVAAADLANRH